MNGGLGLMWGTYVGFGRNFLNCLAQLSFA